jgi:hypothetical protein
MSDELLAVVERHTELYNACLVAGDWAPFLATYAEDAQWTFVDQPARPIIGRAHIAGVFRKYPPTDAMALDAVETVAPDTVRVTYYRGLEQPGVMEVRWRDGMVAEVRQLTPVPSA